MNALYGLLYTVVALGVVVVVFAVVVVVAFLVVVVVVVVVVVGVVVVVVVGVVGGHALQILFAFEPILAVFPAIFLLNFNLSFTSREVT